jgi:hypothetical protein
VEIKKIMISDIIDKTRLTISAEYNIALLTGMNIEPKPISNGYNGKRLYEVGGLNLKNSNERFLKAKKSLFGT